MRIRFYDGRSEEAILLSARGNAVRVAIRDREDSAEFRLQDGQWLSEADLPVQIEGLPGAGAAMRAPEHMWIN